MVDQAEVKQARKVLRQNRDMLFSLPGVIGTGVGLRKRKGKLTDEIRVHVFVEKKIPRRWLSTTSVIPASLHAAGVTIKTDVIQCGGGEDDTLDIIEPDRNRYRPVEGGCLITSRSYDEGGTLGAWAGDNTDDSFVFLTAGHVISNFDRSLSHDEIDQPAEPDFLGSLPNTIGKFKRSAAYLPYSGVEADLVAEVDAAIGTIEASWSSNILDINSKAIFDSRAPYCGMRVQKRGFRTRHTYGTVFSVDDQFVTNYRYAEGDTVSVLVKNSFLITTEPGDPYFAWYGDSGSLVLDTEPGVFSDTFPAVGLLYGGDDLPGCIRANDISAVFNELNITSLCTNALQVIFGLTSALYRMSPRHFRNKDTQFRSFREQLRQSKGLGKMAVDILDRKTPQLISLLLKDDKTLGLSIEAFAPIIAAPTNHHIHEFVLDDEHIDKIAHLMDHLNHVSPGLKKELTGLRLALKLIKGRKIGDVFDLDISE